VGEVWLALMDFEKVKDMGNKRRKYDASFGYPKLPEHR